MEQKVFSFKLPGYGSLYHKHDIQEQAQIALHVEDFCVGPVAARQFWHDERSHIEIDRGPCEYF
jgi:hypothetical protein